MTTSSAGRLASLDSLRGAAILAVLASHFVPGVIPLEGLLAHAAIDLGRAGVTLFFLLSGYLIFRNVQVQSCGTFLCRRFFKLMPAYWLNIGIILLADWSIATAAHFSPRSYLASFFAVSDLLGVEAVSGVFWTLLVEIKFYLFIALQYRLFGTRHRFAVLAGLLALEALVWRLRGHGSLTLAYFPVFYLGIEISLAEAAGWRRAALLRVAGVALVLAASLALGLDQHRECSAAYLLLGAAAFVLTLRRGLNSRLMGFLGLTSYSSYLYHTLIAGGIFALFGPVLGAGQTLALLAIAFLVTTVAATALYGLVEVPMVALGRRLLARRPPAKAAELETEAA